MLIKVTYTLLGVEGADEPLTGGVHDLEAEGIALNDTLIRSIAGAEAAGALEVLEATPEQRAALDSHVQSQEDGEAAYAAAVASGEWEQGNLQQFLIYSHDLIVAQPDTADRAYLEVGIADAKQRLTMSGFDVAELALPELPPATPEAPETQEIASTDVATVADVLGGDAA